jgi:hypothetical protein
MSDQKVLIEAYEKVLAEGIWDRTKANWASGTTGVGASVGGYFKGLGSALTGNLQGQQAALSQRQNAQQAATDAKVDSFLKSKASKIEKLATDIETDLNALQINNKNKPITKDTLFNSIYNNVLMTIKNVKPETTQTAPPPPPPPEVTPADAVANASKSFADSQAAADKAAAEKAAAEKAAADKAAAEKAVADKETADRAAALNANTLKLIKTYEDQLTPMVDKLTDPNIPKDEQPTPEEFEEIIKDLNQLKAQPNPYPNTPGSQEALNKIEELIKQAEESKQLLSPSQQTTAAESVSFKDYFKRNC